MEDSIEYDPIELVGISEYPTHYIVVWSGLTSHPSVYTTPDEPTAMRQYDQWVKELNSTANTDGRVTLYRVSPSASNNRKPKPGVVSLRTIALCSATWSGKAAEEVPEKKADDIAYLTSASFTDMKLTVNTTKW